jgi:serine/threonine-protein kinase
VSFETGTTVGDYEIVDLVGRGGMGRVFKVRNLISDRIEAMKVLLPDAAGHPDLAERFTREIKVVAALEHPHIASMRTALRLDGQLVMVMEYVEGASLDEQLRRGPIALWSGVGYITQVLAALDYAHKHGVIHRDIKPSNILITAHDEVKLTDFGIASREGDARLTATGVALGSLYYMSPEQIRATALDARSDLYSVGVTLYECVTGRRPIQGDSYFSIMKGHLEQVPASPLQLLPEQVPPALSRIIEKSLEKAPEKRFQTAEAFREALLAVSAYADPAGFTRLTSAPAGEPLGATQVISSGPKAPIVTPLERTPVPSGPNRLGSVLGLSEAKISGSRIAEPKSPTGGTTAKPIDAESLDKLRKDLAVYIGPMARIIVSRAAKSAKSLKDLYETVASEIPSLADRQKFLSTRPR